MKRLRSSRNGLTAGLLAAWLAAVLCGCTGVAQVSWPPRVLVPEPARAGEPPPPLPGPWPETEPGNF